MASFRINFGRLCLGIAALALALWPASCVKPKMGKERGDWFLWVDRGSLVLTEPIVYPGRPSPPGVPLMTGIPVIGRFFMHRTEPRSLLWPTLELEQPAWVDIPLWQIAGLFLGIGLWAQRTRSTPGLCRCGYDLTGLAAGGSIRCPECGQACQGHPSDASESWHGRENPGIDRRG